MGDPAINRGFPGLATNVPAANRQVSRQPADQGIAGELQRQGLPDTYDLPARLVDNFAPVVADSSAQQDVPSQGESKSTPRQAAARLPPKAAQEIVSTRVGDEAASDVTNSAPTASGLAASLPTHPIAGEAGSTLHPVSCAPPSDPAAAGISPLLFYFRSTNYSPIVISNEKIEKIVEEYSNLFMSETEAAENASMFKDTEELDPSPDSAFRKGSGNKRSEYLPEETTFWERVISSNALPRNQIQLLDLTSTAIDLFGDSDAIVTSNEFLSDNDTIGEPEDFSDNEVDVSVSEMDLAAAKRSLSAADRVPSGESIPETEADDANTLAAHLRQNESPSNTTSSATHAAEVTIIRHLAAQIVEDAGLSTGHSNINQDDAEGSASADSKKAD